MRSGCAAGSATACSFPVFIQYLGGLCHGKRSALDIPVVTCYWSRSFMDDLDRLVGIIAERVKARLNGGAAVRPESLRVVERQTLREVPCVDAPSHEAC